MSRRPCCNEVIGGPSHGWVICKGCGEKWWDYRGGSWDWQPRDCHKCEAKKFIDKMDPEFLKELAESVKKVQPKRKKQKKGQRK